jgi:1-aminocyclopropane-1-carboxylate deaminase
MEALSPYLNQSSLKSLLQLDIADIANVCPLVETPWKALNQKGIRFFIKRDDLIDKDVSGNKIYKLWGHLQQAKRNSANSLLSFGGAWSNHLHALAAAGHVLQIPTIGIVRGWSPATLTATLMDCQAWGMELIFVSRKDYLLKQDSSVVQKILAKDPHSYVIPEGGGGEYGRLFCGELMSVIQSSAPEKATICLPCGTGTTLTGLINTASISNEKSYRLLGFSALKPSIKDEVNGRPSLFSDVDSATDTNGRVDWDIQFDGHCGGYAKINDDLLRFMQDFTEATGILLDPVYTGKMMYAIARLAKSDYWQAGDSVVALHTGGLQGRRGFNMHIEKESAL